MPETIGLQAKLDVSDWSANVSKYLGDVEKMTKATQNAGQSIGGSFSGLGNVGGIMGGITNALGGMATVAGGILTANLFQNIASQIMGFANTGLEAVGKAQMLEASLQSLMTSNFMYKQSQETVTAATTKQLMTQDEYNVKLQELNAHLATQRAQYQEQTERVRQMSAVWTDGGLNVQTAKARMDEMALSIQETERKIAGLNTTETTYGETTKTVWTNVMSQAEAQARATKETQTLMDAISKLAVVSPFETESVELVAKYAVGAGMGAKETEAFTKSFMDMAASVGIGSESLGFAADQLLQVKKIGQLTTIDLRQLRRMGIDLEKVIGIEMGMSVDEFNSKAKETPAIFDELFAAITKYSQNTFSGTSEKMAQSVKGIGSTLNDIMVIGSRELFRPIVEAASPMMAQIVGNLSNMVLGGQMQQLGEQAAAMLSEGIAKGGAIVRAFERSFDEGFRMIGYFASQYLGNMGIQIPTTDFILNWAGQVIASIPSALGNITSSISSFLVNEWPKIQESMNNQSDRFWEWATQAASKAGQYLNGLAAGIVTWASSPEAQTQIAAAGQALGNSIVSGLQQKGQDTAGLTQVIMSIGSGLLSVVAAAGGALIAVGGTLVANIIAGIYEKLSGGEMRVMTITQLQQLGAQISAANAWKAVGSALLSQVGNSIKNGAETVGTLIAETAKGWADSFNKVDWNGAGRNILDGLLKGLDKNKDKVLEFFKNIAQDAIDTIKDLFGISSPSKVMAGVGVNIVEGLIGGVTAKSPQFIKAFDKELGLKGILTNQYHMMGGQAQDITNLVRKHMSTVVPQIAKGTFTSTDFQNMVLTMADQITPGAAGRILDEGTGVLIQGFAKFQNAIKSVSGSFMTGNLQGGLSVASSYLNLGKLAADRMNQNVLTLDKLVAEGGGMYGDKWLTATQALQEYNKALNEQAGIQAELSAQQKQQNDLQFLQAQLGLVKSAQDAGLNVKDIFGGITMGLGASLPDMIQATNAVVTAIIGTVNSQLEIASPSKVMRRVGRHIADGLGLGMQDGTNSMLGSLTDMVSPLTGAMPVNNSSTVNNSRSMVLNVSVNNASDADQLVERVRREFALSF